MHEVETLELGYFEEKYPVTVMHMPRQDFLDMVDGLLDRTPQLRTKLRPIAEKMDRFPFSAWIHPDRGCGCVIGEYMVAHDIVTRGEFEPLNVQTLLYEYDPDNADQLERFGILIDEKVRAHVRTNLNWGDYSVVEAVVFDD